MLFRKRQSRWFTEIIRRFASRPALTHTPKSDPLTPRREALGEVELICVVTSLWNYESLMAQLSLREFGSVTINFYGAVADAILAADGDVEFCGPSVVGRFNILHRVEEAQIVEGAMTAFRKASASFDAQLRAQIGVGVCRSAAISGNFGSASRFSFTAMGPSAICAHHLAEEAATLNICEEFVEHFSRPQIPTEPWITVQPHWKIEG
jgi:hypothetical protein